MVNQEPIYLFPEKRPFNLPKNRHLLGNKGFFLSCLSDIGAPVPPGFTLSTEFYAQFKKDRSAILTVWPHILNGLKHIEQLSSKEFSTNENASPLILSVRSGASVSMPGMMDTVLNLGFNDHSTALIGKEINESFAWDCYKRLLSSYLHLVAPIIKENSWLVSGFPVQKSSFLLKQLDTKEPIEIKQLKQAIYNLTGQNFPQNPYEQLFQTIVAVLFSWNSPRALFYRKTNQIDDALGTAVTIQMMVFGNRNNSSGTGVVFSRDPSTGESKLYGEFLQNAQGEDLVSGNTTPQPISRLKTISSDLYTKLEQLAQHLDDHFNDMQDIEFTIDNGKLWILQTRAGQRSGKAMVKIAADLLEHKKITAPEALMRLQPTKMQELFQPSIGSTAYKEIICKGLPASFGAAGGHVVFSTQKAQEYAQKNLPCILVRAETSPEDIDGMKIASGFLTKNGGMTSHAAVIARSMGKCCIVGALELQIDLQAKHFISRGRKILEGDYITINGTMGEVYAGKIPLEQPISPVSTDYKNIMGIADKNRMVKIYANADTPTEVQQAKLLGAEGIGLCRTEHMFFQPESLKKIQRMILASSEKELRSALNDLELIQQNDFIDILSQTSNLPATIRLLDPPLHEFLPSSPDSIELLAKEMGSSTNDIYRRIHQFSEQNPMLGYRGCRLGIVEPAIYKMQVRALVRALNYCLKQGLNPQPEIMIPFIQNSIELSWLIDLIKTEIALEKTVSMIPIGTMIELPRACMIADKLAPMVDFFSFGTNDLTQTTLGISRDDSNLFLPFYVEKNIYSQDPFLELDTDGVGELIKIAIQKGKQIKPQLKIGVCGEHAAHPSSVNFFCSLGFDYLSCSTYRIPTAKIAAAQNYLSVYKKP